VNIPPDKKNKNIKKYYGWQLISGFFFIYAIQAIYLLSKGITASELAIFASATAISSTILEIPTGYIADRFSRKLSISLGFIFQGLSYFALIFVHELKTLLPLAVLIGLGSSMLSGSVESLLYDLLKSDNDQSSYLKVSSKGSAVRAITGAIATFVGPLLYMLNHELPFILTGTIFFVLSLYILTIKEKRYSEEIRRNIGILDGIKGIIKNKSLLIITLVDMILFIVVNLFYQVLNFPKLAELGFPIELLGGLDVVNLIFASIILISIPRLIFKNHKHTLMAYSFATMVAFVFFYLSSSLSYVVIVMVTFDLIWTARRHIIPVITNEFYDSSVRATSISSMSFISNLGASILVPFAFNLFTKNALFTLIPLVLITALLCYYPNESNTK